MKINIIEYLESTLKIASNKIAVIDKDRQISFGELSKKSKKVATHLIQQKIIKSPIAVFLPKSIESILSNIAITYSGNIYMNLDIKNPIERIKNIISLIKPSLIITDSNNISKLYNIPNVNILNIDNFNFNIKINHKLINTTSMQMIDTDPYCIINTSGSTGTPKGVVLNHRSFIDFTERSLEIFNISNDEVIGSLSPLIFDIYSFELCLMMAKSATIVLIPDNLSAFPIEILKILQIYNISFLFWVPTIMVNIANMDLLSKIDLPSLKNIWFAGEVFPTKQFNYWYKYLKQVTFANLYGPIEITLDCTFYKIERKLSDKEPIPIGFAYKNTDILILDENNQLAQEGELCVRGSSLAMGYYNNPEKTATSFVQNPLNKSYPEIIYRTNDIVSINKNGEMVIKGRKDNIIKHMGYRIELDEIEHIVINVLKIVKNCCVCYNKEKKEIVLFYESDKDITPANFIKDIGSKLPRYMIPKVYHKMDILPRNTNGKIDRLKLKNMLESSHIVRGGGDVDLPKFYLYTNYKNKLNLQKITNVTYYLEKTIKSHKNKIGFECKNEKISFNQFYHKSKNISTNLIIGDIGLKNPIGIFMSKSIKSLISFMGILYSGNIYMPLNIKDPKKRLIAIKDNIKPTAIITDSENLKRAKEIFIDVKIYLYEDIVKDVQEIKTQSQYLIDIDPAYIINTSGSTGTPKGVVISHRSIIDYIEWATMCYAITDKDIIGSQSPFYFDNSVLDIYLTIKNGCRLILTPDELFVFPIELLKYYIEKSINMIFFVPSILINIANTRLLDKFKPQLNKILFAGEAMPTKQLNYWIKHYPNAVISNLYGPTEITVDCTYYIVNRHFSDNEALPIGKPCRNSNVIILNENNELVESPNKVGELCVRGSSLALGYYNDFDKTSIAFTQNPLHKCYNDRIYKTGDLVYYNNNMELIFLGRKDFQIKHMGYRIEIGEIETALGAINDLKNIAVIYDNKHSKITLFYESDEEISVRNLIERLSNSIPKYMIPTHLRRLDKLPINSNGKIDRLKLQQLLN